tara:strand:- start:878 stop:1006 length:129 start_codon:yes stop_codon:yes gene_type:complete
MGIPQIYPELKSEGRSKRLGVLVEPLFLQDLFPICPEEKEEG